MTSFAVIDFETLNEGHDSVCAIGYAIVDDGEIQDSAGIPVCPHELRIGNWQVKNLELSVDHVAGCPRLSAIWPDVETLIGDRLLFAHSAGSDASMARQSAEANGMECPPIELACSRALAKAMWPDLGRYDWTF